MSHDPNNKGCHYDPHAFTQGGNEYTDFCTCPRTREELAAIEARRASQAPKHSHPTNVWNAVQTIALLAAIVAVVYIIKVY